MHMKWPIYLIVGICFLLLVTALLNTMRWTYYENGRYCLDRWTGIRYAVTDKVGGEYIGGTKVPEASTEQGAYNWDFTKPPAPKYDLSKPAWDFTRPKGVPSDAVYVAYKQPNPFLDTAKYVFGSAGILVAFGFTVRFATAWGQNHGKRIEFEPK